MVVVAIGAVVVAELVVWLVAEMLVDWVDEKLEERVVED